ncbi:anthranilate phosphoribosyltransferase [Gynuella sunshinyii]|uniref:Anthranilate phosphoribosyltransferase n=1 Tax=Gynuella sunshinyii YC6258 TaxID=1445510 RepID=A0A0C5VSS7_9GAMM|nr:anthranilate phosphoribosyltransferase [Gynuella sunshinyii]AJQ96398.1 anthranilate phosphoribosyltransferase [Gynuella sunshinyii YC6258]
MNMQEAIAKVVSLQHLSRAEMQSVMRLIMTGESTSAQTGGFLIALRMKGETVDEVTAAVEVMRELSTGVKYNHEHMVDTCGTGGDGASLFNVSTAASFVVAAAGGKVAKHGNRSASSNSGSADVLEQAGVKIDLTPDQVSRCVDQVGVGFMFAQLHHPAMKHTIGPRKEMKTRTIFNILGPMTNPAGATKQVIGVFNKEVQSLVAEVLKTLGSRHILVIHSDDGLDEISIATTTSVTELKDGNIRQYQIRPEDFGIANRSLEGLQAHSAAESLTLIKAALANESGEAADKARDMIALNAGAAIYAADIANSLTEGVTMAQDAIASGQALNKLDELIAFTEIFA